MSCVVLTCRRHIGLHAVHGTEEWSEFAEVRLFEIFDRVQSHKTFAACKTGISV